MLHHKGLNPVVVALLGDAIGDGGELLQQWPGQTPQGGEGLLDGGRIERALAGSVVGCGSEP